LGNDNIEKLTMPKWGLSMTHGKVVQWLVEEGASVSHGAGMVEVETEKITGAVESLTAGVVRRLVAGSGDEIPVGGLLAVIAAEDVPQAQIDQFIENFVLEEVEESDESADAEPEYAEVGNRRLRYLQRGEGGCPALLLHGFTGNLNNWLFNHSTLASDRTVFALDLPGHGQSSKDVGDGSLEVLIGAVAEWCESVGLDSVHLIGHSMGGAIALGVTLLVPEKVRSCTLIASAGLGSEINAEYISGVVSADRRKQLKPHLEKLFADAGQVTRQIVDDMLKFKRVDGVQDALTLLASRFVENGRQARSFRDQLSQMEVPLQVIWGAEDQIIPVAHAADLSETARVQIVESCGHMVQMEAAGEVNRLIESFLSEVDG